jgi:hypothetical protein
MIYFVAKKLSFEDIDNIYAVVAELADAHGSGPCGLTPRGGSSPLDRINLTMNELLNFLSWRFKSFLHTRNLQGIAHHLS